MTEAPGSLWMAMFGHMEARKQPASQPLAATQTIFLDPIEIVCSKFENILSTIDSSRQAIPFSTCYFLLLTSCFLSRSVDLWAAHNNMPMMMNFVTKVGFQSMEGLCDFPFIRAAGENMPCNMTLGDAMNEAYAGESGFTYQYGRIVGGMLLSGGLLFVGK